MLLQTDLSLWENRLFFGNFCAPISILIVIFEILGVIWSKICNFLVGKG